MRSRGAWTLSLAGAIAAGCANEGGTGEALVIDVAPGALEVGDFTVELGEDAVAVRHPSRERPALETVPGVPFVEAGIAVELVSELAGSFEMDEEVRARCDRQRVSRFELDGAAALIAGEVSGEGCSARYELRLEAGARRDELVLRLSLAADDQEVDRVALVHAVGGEERFLGFGVQYSELDMRGRAVPIWVREQGIGRGAEPVTSTVDALYRGSGGDWHTSYAPLPYWLSSDGRALALDDDRYAVFDFTEPGRARISEWSTAIGARLWVADEPLALVEAFTGHTGRMAPLPGWTGAGAVVRASGGSQAVRDRVAAMREAGVPLAAVWIEDWVGERETPLGSRLWWNWEPDAGSYPDWTDLVAELAASGVKTLIYFNPYLADAGGDPDAARNLYAEARERGFLVTAGGGEPYLMDQVGFQAAMVDLSSEPARAFLTEAIRRQLDAGVAGFMADFGEALPMEATLASGASGAELHNRYPVEWARLCRQAMADHPDAIAFHRSGYLGSAAEARLFWLGDQLVTWDRHDGLATVVPGLLSGGLSGFALSHGDIGGYTSIASGDLEVLRTRELLWRWIELAAFTALYRTHETPLRDLNWQVDSDPETLAHFARFARLFAALAPYRSHLMEEAAATGAPLVRHLLLHAPDEPEAWAAGDEFLLGPDLLVAPVVEEGATRRDVLLPPGSWVHAWSGVEHDAPRATRVTVDAPLGSPPVFYRRGSVVGELFSVAR
jgi:sulfoquinovosidase